VTLVCINAYALRDVHRLAWPVRRYTVTRSDGQAPPHEERGALKNAAFALRRHHSARCSGWGFVIDTDPNTFVLPSGWDIPTRAEVNGLTFKLTDEFIARAEDPRHDAIVGGIVRDGLKRHLKEARSNHLGPLWQDFGRFCEMPRFRTDDRHVFCRSFSAQLKRLAGDRLALLIGVGTSVIDGYSIADYLSRGMAEELAEMLQWRRSSRSRRDASPAAVRAYVHGDGYLQGRIVELDDPDLLEGYGSLPQDQQAQLAGATVPCREFKKPLERLAAGSLHLIVDTRETEELHSETIIAPPERMNFVARVRRHLAGAELFGVPLALDESAFDVSRGSLLVPPPAICVRNARGTTILRRPQDITHQTLYERARRRKDHIVRHGFLITRPMRPLIGVHQTVGPNRARRLQVDATEILLQHGISNVAFAQVIYSDVSEIQRRVEDGGYDALLAVLPATPDAATTLHEEIKRRIEVPSQCMQARNIIPASWANRPANDFHREQGGLARALQGRLETSVLNLLVKHNWVPFVPAESFNYNVQVGIDVGGLHNTHAMACVGYGFGDAHGGLAFRLGEIPIVGQKREPIPSDALHAGLLELFDRIAQTLLQANIAPDFSRTIFYRDGPLLGRGDDWNERDALVQLHASLVQRGWIPNPPLWTALEIMKEAEGLRVFDMCPQAENPLVGRCTFPFAEKHLALVSSTGRPYLSQGTAAPLKVRMIDLIGHAEFGDALRDLIWQCDMGFTKPDMGISLPWVLHVADTGALQASRSYRITGIAA